MKGLFYGAHPCYSMATPPSTLDTHLIMAPFVACPCHLLAITVIAAYSYKLLTGIGHHPNSGFLDGQLELDPHGYVTVSQQKVQHGGSADCLACKQAER